MSRSIRRSPWKLPLRKEFAQPTTATSGLAGYDLEGQKEKTPKAKLRFRMVPRAKVDSAR